MVCSTSKLHFLFTTRVWISITTYSSSDINEIWKFLFILMGCYHVKTWTNSGIKLRNQIFRVYPLLFKWVFVIFNSPLCKYMFNKVYAIYNYLLEIMIRDFNLWTWNQIYQYGINVGPKWVWKFWVEIINLIYNLAP